jgi:hypothetical protein
MCYPAIGLSSPNAKVGQELTVTGSGFSTSTADVTVIRWNALDGPVLATVQGPLPGGNLAAKIVVPQDAQPGSYVLVITRQDSQGALTMAPVRAVFTVVGDTGAKPVVGAPPAAVDTSARATSFEKEATPLSVGSLALVALGTGGLGMFLAGIAAMVVGRRSSVAATVAVHR